MSTTSEKRFSVEYMRECFDYRDGVLYWKERPAHHFRREADHVTFIKKSAGKAAGRDDSRGYKTVKMRIDGYPYCISVHRIVWAIHHGKWPELHLDHINRVRDDNCIENLREVTPAENNRNSVARNVYPCVDERGIGRYSARVHAGDRSVYLGTFSSEEEAHSYRQTVIGAMERVARAMAQSNPRLEQQPFRLVPLRVIEMKAA